MKHAQELIGILLDQAPVVGRKAARSLAFLAEGKVYPEAWTAAASVPRSGWQDWRTAGVRFSGFHKDGTAFALPFRPEDYLWAGPFTLKIPEPHLKGNQDFRLGHYRRGVKKYSAMLAKGLKLPPVVLLYHEAWGWTMQDGNHRYAALVKAGASTYDAFLGKPTVEKPIDSF